MRRGLLAFFVVTILLTGGASASARDDLLSHDSGTMGGKQSSAGTGHVVTFRTPKGKWWIKEIHVHGARYGGGYDPAATPFTAAICDAKLKPLSTTNSTYSRFKAGRFGWVRVPLETPVRAPATFKAVVSFDPTAKRGVFVAWAKTTRSHSGLGLPGGRERPVAKDREWMIRVVLTDREPEALATIELAHDDGEMLERTNLGGNGHVIEFDRPSGTWWVRSVRIFGLRYGDGYDPASITFRTDVCSTSMKSLHEQRAPYALFPGAAFGWVEVRMAAAVKVPRRFRIAVESEPTAERGIFVGYSRARSSHSRTGRVGAATKKWKEGDWMIRVVLTKTKPDLPDAKPPGEAKALYVEDFEFLAETIGKQFPALAKKGVDWSTVTETWRPRFTGCRDDQTHVLNVHRLLALLGDAHTGVTASRNEVHVPSFDGLYGAGLWIETSPDGRRRLLRAMRPGHALESKLRPGAELLRIFERPAAVVHEEVRRRLRTWHGWSSTHFLDARLSFQFFPFGDAPTLPATFLNPSGQVVEVLLPRWGPGGRGLSRAEATMPAGVEAKGPVAAAMLDDEIGYVRILGGMSDGTRDAFFEKLETVRSAKGLLLDCRGMGGGGDRPAWAMAGRFFERSTPQGSAPALSSKGWAFTGPVVMLQDAREISSAETFTWAMTETGRVVSVGKATGGATIIPRGFEVPSGIVKFRMGCTDRKTPIRGVQPEGIGSIPDIFVPDDPSLLRRLGDPERGVGLDVLRFLVAGEDAEVVKDAYGGVLGADPARLARGLERFRRLDRPGGIALADLGTRLVDALVADELRRCTARANPMPGFVASADRLERLAAVADQCGRKRAARDARKAVAGWGPEIEAQKAWEALLAGSFPPSRKDTAAFVKSHAGTRYAEAAKEAFRER